VRLDLTRPEVICDCPVYQRLVTRAGALDLHCQDVRGQMYLARHCGPGGRWGISPRRADSAHEARQAGGVSREHQRTQAECVVICEIKEQVWDRQRRVVARDDILQPSGCPDEDGQVRFIRWRRGRSVAGR
jgi:hypothetical protein